MKHRNTLFQQLLTFLPRNQFQTIVDQHKGEKALNSIIKIASHPDDTFIKSTGEVFTESLGRIFASICNGNLKQIKTVIENQNANPWMRAGALDCLMVL